MNSAFHSKTIQQNIQDIGDVKHQLTQTRTEYQRNLNEKNKLKDQLSRVNIYAFIEGLNRIILI